MSKLRTGTQTEMLESTGGRGAVYAPTRDEIASRFGDWLGRLQFRGEGYRDGRVFRTFGMVHVPDLYEPRQQKKRQRFLTHLIAEVDRWPSLRCEGDA